MPEIPLNFIKGDEVSSETDYRDALPVNMTAVSKQLFGANGYMIQQSGLTEFAEAKGIDRGGIWNEQFETHFRVSGTKLISVDASGVITELGDIPGVDTVRMPYSFNTQAIIADEKYYLYDPTNGLRQVTDSDVGMPIDADWIAGYYFFTDGVSLYHTQITDESSIDPTDFGTFEFSPDPTKGVLRTQDNKMAVFDRYSTGYFVNDTTTAFAFSIFDSRTVKVGIVGTHCKCEIEGSIFIMGGAKEENVSVHILGVGSSTKVATREIDKLIGKYSEEELSKSVLESRAEDGYHYLIVHLPDETLIYNHTIAKEFGYQNAWSILRSGNSDSDNYRAKFGVLDVRINKWVYGDKRESKLCILDETVCTHYGEISEWELFTPFYYIERASIDQMMIETIPGFSTTDDATVFLSISYDGVTSTKEYSMQYGRPNQYTSRFILRRLGDVNNWFSMKLRGASRSRMAFSRGVINYG